MKIPMPRRHHETAKPVIIKEFAPRDKEAALSAGRLIVRETSYGSSMDKLMRFTDILIADAAAFEPPLTLTPADVEVVEYAGERYARTFGVEANVPEGHRVAADYSRLQHVEYRF